MISFLTGDRQVGKTTWLGKLVHAMDRAGIPMWGLVTPAVFKNGSKTGIDAVLFPNRERFNMAIRTTTGPFSSPKTATQGQTQVHEQSAMQEQTLLREQSTVQKQPTTREQQDPANLPDPRQAWSFSDEAMRRINANFAEYRGNTPNDAVLLVDELGPLEMVKGEGLTEAMAILDSGDFSNAIVVMRPELMETAIARWGEVSPGGYEVIEHGTVPSFLPELQLEA